MLQSKAGPVGALHGRSRLVELAKDRVDGYGCDARPCVGDTDADTAGLCCDGDAYFSLFGELDRIAKRVAEDLPKPAFVNSGPATIDSCRRWLCTTTEKQSSVD